MTMPNDPIFVPGDRVVSFRGELATVKEYRVIDEPGKSNRVTVQWDKDDPEDEDKIEYYAGVFSHQ